MGQNSPAVRQARPQVISVTLGMILFHGMCLLVFVTGVSWAALAVAFVMYVVRGMGVTAGFHRLLAHRSFKTNRVVQFLLAFAGSLAVQGGPLWWVAHHRAHHAETDTDEDIHSPVTHGMWAAHMGWMMSDEAFNEKGTNSRDLHKFPEIKALQRHYVWLIVGQIAALYLLGWALQTAWPSLQTSGAQMVVWGFFVSTVFTWHVTFMVNSVCHRWGGTPYDTGDASTNNVFIGILAFGEGWHNNHHFYPNSARHGLRWWQLDVTWYLIKVMSWLGMASDLKLPRELRERKLKESRTA
ncbi:MAG: fatty acid desaturase [Pseudomonadota bacterium]